MNKILIEKNKAKLLAELKRLQAVLNHETDSDQEIPGGRKPKYTEAGSEEGENASESEQFGNDLAITEDLDVRLKQVEAALQRIADGTYGICLVGGEKITEDRLQAEPAADTCVKHSGNA